MKKIISVSLAAAMLIALTACGGGNDSSGGTTAGSNFSGGSSDATYTISIGHTTAPSEYDPYYITCIEFEKLVEEQSDGRIQVEVYSGGQLGSETEMFEGMQMGTLDMGIITNAYVSAYVTACGAFDLPFIFEDLEQARSVVDGEFGQTLMDALEGSGVTNLGWSEGGFRQLPTVGKPVYTPDDIAGMKIRCMETRTYLAAYAALDVNATPMAWSETITSLQQGAIDGLDIPNSVTYANGFPDVADYYNMLNMFYSPLQICIADSTLEKFSEEDQQLLRDCAVQAGIATRAANDENDAFMLSDMAADGLEIIETSEIDFEAFREKASSCYSNEELRDYIGAEYVDELLGIVGIA